MSSPSQWNVPPWNTALWNQGPGASAAGRQGGPPSIVPILTGQIIPLNNSPNQSLQVALATFSGSLTLNLQVSFNEVGQFWVMSIYDQSFNPVVSDVPLLTGYWPAANILGPWSYANIGGAYVINQSGGAGDWPGANGWGSGGYLLLWDASMVTAPLVSTALDIS